jgi:hypothetical protein
MINRQLPVAVIGGADEEIKEPCSDADRERNKLIARDKLAGWRTRSCGRAIRSGPFALLAPWKRAEGSSSKVGKKWQFWFRAELGMLTVERSGHAPIFIDA